MGIKKKYKENEDKINEMSTINNNESLNMHFTSCKKMRLIKA